MDRDFLSVKTSKGSVLYPSYGAEKYLMFSEKIKYVFCFLFLKLEIIWTSFIVKYIFPNWEI